MFSNENKQGFKVLNGKDRLFDQRGFDLKSRLFLFFSIFLMLSAFIVIFLDNVGFFIYASQIGGEKLISWFLFAIGGIINFFCVPILYWSSFHKFKKGDEFWDSESFWILPLFFFGCFFQYLSNLPYIMVILPSSLILIFSVHIWVMSLSRELIVTDEQFENSAEYFRSFTYLTAYYLVLAVVIVFFDLFDKFENWIG